MKSESQAYEVIQFISDFAGTAGLWLGMSLLCVLEWGIFFVLLLWWCLSPPKRLQIGPGYNYFAELEHGVSRYFVA